MAVMFDSALTAALGTALNREWSGRHLEAAWFAPEQWSVRLDFDTERVTWCVHPQSGFLLRGPVPGGKRPRGKRGVLSARGQVIRVDAGPDTRRLTIVLDADRSIVFELAANRRNALYVALGRIREVLRRGRTAGPKVGGEWSPRASDRLWSATIPDRAEWVEALGTLSGDDAVGRVAYLSRFNRDFVIPDSVEADLDGSHRRYLELREAIHADPPVGWLLGTDAVQPYPCSLGQGDAPKAASLAEALSASLEASRPVDEMFRKEVDDPEPAAIRGALASKRKRAVRKLKALRNQLEEGARATELRECGNILLARKAQVRGGLSEVTLEGFAGTSVTIRLDPRLDVTGNADAYYKRARRLDRATRELPSHIEDTQRRVDELDSALEQLETDGPSAALRELAGLRREGGSGAPVAQERLPYRVYRTSNGLEIRAGRTARDNDALTFKHSSSNDIWMHVRESPGSHVVLRWDNREQNPPPRDLEEAAIVAAVLSRARGSSMVPVSWTRRKYVRKPRKAAPGSVVTQRTKTIFVEPDEKLVGRLAEQE